MRWVKMKDLKSVKGLADQHRHELGFVKLPALQEAIKEQRIFVALSSPLVPRPIPFCPPSPVPRPVSIGFVHFRCCRDGHATIYEIAVAREWRGKGVGKALVNAVIEEAKKRGCKTLRLKCPVDLPANGFYHRLGFKRIAVEDSKHPTLKRYGKLLRM